MPKFLFLTKLLFKKQQVSRQALRWTPILIQQKLQNDAFKAYFFGLIGVPHYFYKTNEYLKQLQFRNSINTVFNSPVPKGLTDLRENQSSSYTPQHSRQGDFKQIRSGQFVHAVQMVQNPMQMDEFSLDDVESIVSDFEQDEDINNSQLSESLVLSWNSSTAFETGSTLNSSDFNNAKFAV